MAVQSGVPKTVGGVWIGATDFSEFAVAAGQPAGLTLFGTGADEPTIFGIENDPAEGNLFSMDGQGTSGTWAFGYDAFAGLIEFGELLMRFFVDAGGPPDNRRTIGPALSIAGATEAEIDYTGQSYFRRTGADYESHAAQVNNGAAGIAAQGNLQEAFQFGVWGWQRMRRLQNVGDPSKDDYEVTSWYGDLADEPASPDITVSDFAAGPRGLGALGWAMTELARGTEQKIAFLSFTGDPLTQPAPTEIVTTTAWDPCDADPATTWTPS